MRPYLSAYTITTCLLFIAGSTGHAEILGGWDGSGGNLNSGLRFTGFGTQAYPNDSYIYGTIQGQPVQTAIHPKNGSTTLKGGLGAEIEITFRIDIDGSEHLLFEEFWVSMQRAGNLGKGENTVRNARASTNHFSTPGYPLQVREVSIGLSNGKKNVGPFDTITKFRKPNGLGGGIHPQQAYQFSGLEQAGELNSGSLWIRYTVDASSAGKDANYITLINDRYDLSTTGIALAVGNTINDPTDGVIDGYDTLWTGKKVDIPEPTSLAAITGLLSASLIMTKRRRPSSANS